MKQVREQRDFEFRVEWLSSNSAFGRAARGFLTKPNRSLTN